MIKYIFMTSEHIVQLLIIDNICFCIICLSALISKVLGAQLKLMIYETSCLFNMHELKF